MITVTDGARELLHEALGQLQEGECFRLARGTTGTLALVTGKPVENDLAIEHAQKTILVVEPEVADDLDGRTVDIEDGKAGKKGLVLL